MHTSAGLLELHALTHASLDKLFAHSRKLTDAELLHELPGFGFASVHSQLFHIADCEEFWVGGLSGWSKAEHRPAEFTDVAALDEHRRQVAAQTAQYLRAASADELNTQRLFVSGGTERKLEVPAQVVLHVLTHAFHHKGQTVAMYRLLGYPPPETDLI